MSGLLGQMLNFLALCILIHQNGNKVACMRILQKVFEKMGFKELHYFGAKKILSAKKVFSKWKI